VTAEYRIVDPANVVVACYPNGPVRYDTIWARRFVGVKIGEQSDGTFVVQTYGPVSDLSQSVFRKGQTL